MANLSEVIKTIQPSAWLYFFAKGFFISKVRLDDALVEKKIKFSPYIRKFRVEQLQSHMTKSFLIYEEMRKYFPIHKEAASHI